MFKSLFKPKWQHTKPEIRITAISQFRSDDPEQQRILEQVARNDTVPAVRIAALQRLQNIEILISIIQNERDSDTRQKAESHLMQLLGKDNPNNITTSQLTKTLGLDNLIQLLERTRNPTFGEQILATINDEPLLASLATRLPLAALRQTAAQRVDTQSLLEDLLKTARGKDKSVYRIVKDKLDAIHNEQQAEASTEQKINDACSALEAHARLPIDPLYVAKYEHLQKQWQRLQPQASADQQQRYQRATAMCRAQIEENAAEANKLQEEAHKQRQATQERVAACEQLEEALKQLSFNAVLESDDAPALTALLTTQKNRWEEAASVSPPQTDERKRFQKAYTQLENLLNASVALQKRETAINDAANALLDSKTQRTHELLALKKALDDAADGIHWPADARMPTVLELRARAQEHFIVLLDALQKAEQEALARVEQGLKALLKEIERGNLKASNNALRECQQQVKMLPMNKAQTFQRQLRDLTIKVNELRDWQGFATLPKKEALVESMEALVGASLDPQALANRIKRLQDEWRMLGNADAERSQPLWARFSTAADKAYEPCRDYFDKLTQVREDNLKARQAICQQLYDYLHNTDWSKVDWRAAREIFEVAKQEWSRYSPVERKAGKDVQTRFNDLLRELQQRLEHEFEKNAQARRALIVEAESLLQASDLHSAIEKAKQLQRQWKDTGWVAPREDGKLWKQFRAACDGLFSRRDQQRVDAQAERERHVADAEAICDQIEKLADSVTLDMAATQEQFVQLQDQFDQLGNLPKEQIESIRKRYRTVCDHFRQNLGHAQIQQRSRRFDSLWQVSEWLDDQETHVLAGESAPAGGLPLTDPLPQGAEPLALQRLKQLQSDALDSQPALLGENAEKLRELCVRLEIGAGLDSPPEDREFRMQFQISRFNKGASQRDARLSVAELVELLQVEWLGVGPVIATERQRYAARFRQALQQANA